jgi:hypothetical protein
VTDHILKPTSDVSQTPQIKGGIAGLEALLNPPSAPAAPPVAAAGPAAASGGSGTSVATVGPRLSVAAATHAPAWLCGWAVRQTDCGLAVRKHHQTDRLRLGCAEGMKGLCALPSRLVARGA